MDSIEFIRTCQGSWVAFAPTLACRARSRYEAFRQLKEALDQKTPSQTNQCLYRPPRPGYFLFQKGAQPFPTDVHAWQPL